jgi:hypothetical protein
LSVGMVPSLFILSILPKRLVSCCELVGVSLSPVET